MITFSNTPFTRITVPNCSNPSGIKEKVHTFKTGETFRYVWDNGWEIYERLAV
jgi:hypothetical protein